LDTVRGSPRKYFYLLLNKKRNYFANAGAMRTADAAAITPKSREKGGSGDTPVPTTVPHWSSGARVTASGAPVVPQPTPWSLQPGWSPPFRLLHGPRPQKSQRAEASPV